LRDKKGRTGDGKIGEDEEGEDGKRRARGDHQPTTPGGEPEGKESGRVETKVELRRS
jgi:hypothetical protein